MKQSAAILALFLGTTSAVKLHTWGDDKKEAAPLPPEKVHNLKPTHAQDLSNNMDSDYPTFPQPVGIGAGRTAFYAQTDSQWKPWDMTPNPNAPNTKVQSVNGPPYNGTDQIGETVHEAAMEGGDDVPNVRNLTGYEHPKSFVPGPPEGSLSQVSNQHQPKDYKVAPENQSQEEKALSDDKDIEPKAESQLETGDDSQFSDKRIGEAGYAPWVYQFSYEAMPPVNGWRSGGTAGPKYGWHPSNQHPQPPAHGSYGSDTVNPPSFAQHRHHHKHHHQHKAKDIGDEGIVEEVHGFVNNDKSVLPQPWRRAKEAYPQNGFKNPSFQWLDKKSLAQHKHHHHHQHKAKDIGDEGIVEEVHGFVNNDKSVLPQPWRRAKEAYPVNGFKNPSFQWLDKKSLAQHKHHHHHQHKAKDIGDEGIVEEVHGFVNNDKSVLPQPWRRAKEAYPVNGFKNPSFQWLDKKALAQHQHHHKHHHQHKAKDIGDEGIVEEVHGFVNNDKSVLPQPWRRAKEAYPKNGFKNPSFQWLTLAEKEKNTKDIGDNGIDEAVHGFASNDKSVLPTPWRRAKEAYPENGFKNPKFQWVDAKALAQKDKADIGDKKIAEEVHGFATKDPNVLPTPYDREEAAHDVNGTLNPKFQHLQQKKDIANNKDVRPDVWHFVNENIGSIPIYRRKTPPKHNFEPGRSGQGIEIVSSGPSSGNADKAKAKSLAQVNEPEALAEGKAKASAPQPEKVVVLQPLEYQHRANTNTPNLRTTFYAQQEK